MKLKIIKKCDRCLKRGKNHKRFYVGSQFPFYSYVGFDLCENCEKDLEIILNKFLRAE